MERIRVLKKLTILREYESIEVLNEEEFNKYEKPIIIENCDMSMKTNDNEDFKYLNNSQNISQEIIDILPGDNVFMQITRLNEKEHSSTNSYKRFNKENDEQKKFSPFNRTKDRYSPDLFGTNDCSMSEEDINDENFSNDQDLKFKTPDGHVGGFYLQSSIKQESDCNISDSHLNNQYELGPTSSHKHVENFQEHLQNNKISSNETNSNVILDDATMSPSNVKNERGKRLPKECELCHKFIVNMSRHLKGGSHKISPTKVKSLCFAMKRRKKPLNVKGLRKCPLAGCEHSAAYTRLSSHLKTKHNLTVSDKTFQDICPTKNRVSDVHGVRKTLEFTRFSIVQSEKFYTHLRSLAGGEKSETNAGQHKYKARTILNELALTEIYELRDKQMANKLETWTVNFALNHGPTSVITYLNVFIKYLKYVRRKLDRDNTEIEFLLEELIGFIGTYRNKTVANVDHENIAEEQLQLFESSDVVKNAMETFELLGKRKPKTHVFDKDSHAELRNVLLTALLIWNSKRSGVLANMLLTEFEKKEYIEKHKCYIVRVKEHKTKGEYGPS